MDDQRWMRLAIATCRDGIAKGQSPFGATIVRGDELIVAAHNIVWETTDISAHAEVTAIRLACKKLATVNLSGCTIYSTCEPCPMCFSTCHWAKLDRIVFGTTIPDANGIGFSELPISNEQMKTLGRSRIEVVGEFLREESLPLFQEWVKANGSKTY